MKKLPFGIEVGGLLISLCALLLDNAARLPFVVRVLSPSHDRAQRSVNAFFHIPKSHNSTNDFYFKDFEEFVIWGLSTFEVKERRVTNIAPGAISEFEYVPFGLPYNQDIEGDALSNWIRIRPQVIYWNKANIEKALNRHFDTFVGQYRLPLGLSGIFITAFGMLLKYATDKRKLTVAADGLAERREAVTPIPSNGNTELG